MKLFGWPVGWFILARSIQLLLGVVVLGIVCFFAAIYGTPVPMPFRYLVGIGAVTVCWTFTSFILHCTNELAPLLVVIVDTAVLLAWIAAIALDLRDGAYMLSMNCKHYIYDDYPYAYPDYSYAFGSTWCQLWKAKTGIMIVQSLSFTVTIALAAATFRKRRKRDSVAESEYGGVLFPGSPSADGPQDDIQVPQYTPYSPEASPVLWYPQSQQLQQVPQPAYDPLGGMRHAGPPQWQQQQQYHMDMRDQPPLGPPVMRQARRPVPVSPDSSGMQEQARPPPPAWY